MRRNQVFRIGVIALLSLIVVFMAAVLIVRSRAFHQYALARIIEQAQQATGGRVEIGGFVFRFWGLRADLHRIALHGTELNPQAPLFQADRLSLALNLVSIWRRKIDVREIVLERPVIHLWIDERGRTNMPEAHRAPGTRPVNVFDLAIGHFVINQGEIYYNDRQAPLAAEVRDLQTQISFDPLKTSYDGTLGYRAGWVKLGDFNPLNHDFQARFKATLSGLDLSSVVFTSSALQAKGAARLRDYVNPSLDGSYEAVVSGGEMGKVLKNAHLPKGQVTTNGNIRYRNNSQQTVLSNLSIEGRLNSQELELDFPEARTNLRAFKGEYRLDRGTLEARNLQADVLGGQVAAKITMVDLADKRDTSVEGTARGLSLEAANVALRTKPPQPVPIAGRLDGTVKASWRGNMQGLKIRSDATIAAQAPVDQQTKGGSKAIPLDGTVHLAYDGSNQVISLQNTSFITPHTTVRLEGTLGDRCSLAIQAQSNDLHEVDLLMLFVRSSWDRSQPLPRSPELFGLGGSVSFDGQLRGRIKQPRLTGQLRGADVQYQEANLRRLQAQLDLGPSGIALHQGKIQTSSQGSADFDIQVGLQDWSYRPSDLISLRVTANRLPVVDIQRMVNLRYPITGILSANLSVQGSQVNPVGQGSVRVSQARLWGEPIQDLTLRFEGAGTAIRSTLSVRTPAGSGSAKATFHPKDEAYEAQIDFPGVQLEQLEAVRTRGLQVTGLVTMSARGRGVLSAPQLEATITAPKLSLRRKVLDGLKAHATIAREQASFSVDSSVSGAYIQGQGTVNLNSNYEAMVNIDTRVVELGPLVASYLPGRGQDVRGKTEVHGWLKGPLKHPEQLEAQIEIPIFNLGYQSVEVANATPIRIDYRAGTLTLERAELKGVGTNLELVGAIPMVGDRTLRATARGTIDLHILGLLKPGLDSSGQVKLDVSAQGTRTRPDIQGVVQVINAAVRGPNAPLGVNKVNASFDLQKDRIDVRSFTSESGGGSITARGSIALRPAVRFNIATSAKEVRLRYPEGVRTVLNGELALTGTPQLALLNGQVFIERLSFTEVFDLATFADQFTGPYSPSNEGIARNVKLDVGLKSTQEMGVSNSQLSLKGSADLRLRGTAAEPVILGRTLVNSGELFFNDRRYQVQSGVVQFVNPVRTEPVVNLSATTTVDQFNVTLNFVGPIDRLRTTYTSDPPLPPVDVINLLFVGRTTTAAGTPTSPQSVLAQQLAGQVSSRVGKLAGVSSLTIDPQIGGNQGNPGTRLAIQQRVTKNLFFTFATDVTSAQGQVFQIEYQATRKYSLSAMRNQNGGYSFQTKLRKRF